MKDFNELYFGDNSHSNSWIGETKAKTLYEEMKKVEFLEGHTAEIGVYLGGTSKFIHKALPHKVHFCYDTFEGIKGADSDIDKHNDGDFACSLEDVKKNINLDHVIYKKGYFPLSFDEINIDFSFIHSDTDTYIGTKNTILVFTDRLVKGGKIVFDDYTLPSCPGVQKALDEFAKYDDKFIHKPLPHLTQYVLTKKM